MEKIQAKLTVIHSECKGAVVDVKSEETVTALAESVIKQFGTVDILVNNAVLYPVTPFLPLSKEEWSCVMDTNLTGSFLCVRAFARLMIKNNTKGCIINISSTSSIFARLGIAHYASSKAGMNVLAVKLAPHGITVNAICPGVIAMETVKELTAQPQNAKEQRIKLRQISLGRFGEPE